jgi:hypothetical protein
MGTAHIIVHPIVLDLLTKPPFNDLVSIITSVDFGDGMFFCLVSTSLLTDGYHGQMNVVISGDQVKLKRDMDT